MDLLLVMFVQVIEPRIHEAKRAPIVLPPKDWSVNEDQVSKLFSATVRKNDHFLNVIDSDKAATGEYPFTAVRP